jgi:CDGSH-type Zn-finger protein
MAKSKQHVHVTIAKDGPYMVSGAVPLSTQTIVANAEGDSQDWREGKTIAAPESYALCRCGQSKNKPFCDGSHVKIGFDGTETASREAFLEQAKFVEGPDLVLADNESLCDYGR